MSAVPMPEPTPDDGAGAAAGRAEAVLVVGTDQWAIEQAGGQLRTAGRHVLCCHEPGEALFPCNALLPGRRCPLDVGIDVVLDIRARPVNPPALGEFGAVCALRAGIPLVVAGVAGDSGFGPWASSAVESGVELAAACDRAAGEGLTK